MLTNTKSIILILNPLKNRTDLSLSFIPLTRQTKHAACTQACKMLQYSKYGSHLHLNSPTGKRFHMRLYPQRKIMLFFVSDYCFFRGLNSKHTYVVFQTLFIGNNSSSKQKRQQLFFFFFCTSHSMQMFVVTPPSCFVFLR